MSKRFGNGYFALGLILGIGVTILFCLSIWPRQIDSNVGDAEGQQSTTSYADNQISENSERHPLWHWDGGLVTSSDTAAQWIMMIFTVIAAALLLGTLIITQRMLRDTREIGQDQSRAYIHADKAQFFWGSNAMLNPKIVVSVRNSGNTPARWYQIRAKEFLWGDENREHLAPNDWSEISAGVEFGGKLHSVPAAQSQTSIELKLELTKEEIEKIKLRIFGELGAGFGIIGEIRYCSYFGEIFVTGFSFGRAGIPPYEVLEERETGEFHGIRTSEKIERAISLTRMPFNLRAYHYVGKESDYS
ncbi:hypothetical protein [Roseovarius sp. 2305UL8-3]|uniref:hypothetical protein n=1 Tax=Roseovarius conchicola TaxID=3121636 RepID=UPI00352844B3